jgi:hypothetical protein
MKGYIHTKCKTELKFEQICGIRMVRENDEGEKVVNAYCSTCKEYFEMSPDRKTV